MRISYDPTIDALYIRLREADIETTDEVEPGVMQDYDADGNVVGIEVLDASTRIAELPLEKKAA